MKPSIKMTGLIVVSLAASSLMCQAQVSGNAGGYASRRGDNPAENERAKRTLTPAELRPENISTFIEASILMNVPADEYVAVFGATQEGTTLAEANTKMEATIAAFRKEVESLGVTGKNVFVDFVTQNRIYGYQFEGDLAKEQAVGFEIKKNVLIHFKDKTMLDKLTLAAAKVQIFDLIKMDYVVSNAAAVQEAMRTEAAQIIRDKASKQQALLGISLIGRCKS